MHKLVSPLVVFLVVLLMVSCKSNKGAEINNAPMHLRFVDELVLPDSITFKNTRVGGLSSIDYANKNWYIICDDGSAPRFYEADIAYDITGFTSFNIQNVTHFKDINNKQLPKGVSDPEAIRYDNGLIVWTSEGSIKKGIKPFVRSSDLQGNFKKEATLPKRYFPNNEADFGPRHNGVFEGLTLSADKKGYWVSLELPLKEDGAEPSLESPNAPVRIAYINNETGTFEKEVAYPLDKIARPAINGTSFGINGLVEILAYDTHKFLALERSFSMGYNDGGTTVKIYDVDISQATDISTISSLKEATYTKAKKTLLFNFNAIRNELTDGIVDNIEGFSFGPDFKNGNKSLLIISDNNFNAFGSQINQFILLEVDK
ncbi:hypothetical protein SCB49_13040 [unidentified eubacterium SCB49]|nr:hypothetical protein SCB49_13040 [unidentified eubacterium SCB49]